MLERPAHLSNRGSSSFAVQVMLVAMCGRFSLTVRGRVRIAEVEEQVVEIDVPAPRYNVAPGQSVTVIRRGRSGVEGALLRWGLIPSWARDPKVAFQCTNARAETVATRPAFREAFRQRRCAVPVDGFFEWERSGKQPLPWRFVRSDRSVFLLAGLWETWRPPGEQAEVETFTLITTSANADMAPVHDRMPVLLDPRALRTWLDAESNRTSLEGVMQPSPAASLVRHRVSTRVNNARNEDPVCIEPFEESTLAEGFLPLG